MSEHYIKKPHSVRATQWLGNNLQSVLELLATARPPITRADVQVIGRGRTLTIKLHGGLTEHVPFGMWVVVTRGGVLQIVSKEAFTSYRRAMPWEL